MKKIQRLLVAAMLLALPLGVGATASYNLDPEANTFSIHHFLETTNYDLDGSLDPWAAELTNSGYELESGDAFRWYCGDGFIDPDEECDDGTYGENLGGETCLSLGHDRGTLSCDSDCTLNETACIDDSGGGGGGGGGGGSVKTSAPEVDETFTVEGFFTYDDTMLLYGDRSVGTTVRINGSSSGVTYPTSTTWQATVSLSVGNNSLTVQGVNSSGQTSSSSDLTIERHTGGDVNGDSEIDDYDLSLVVKYWGTDNFEGDFNGDGIVDDYDFSILVSQWS